MEESKGLSAKARIQTRNALRHGSGLGKTFSIYEHLRYGRPGSIDDIRKGTFCNEYIAECTNTVIDLRSSCYTTYCLFGCSSLAFFYVFFHPCVQLSLSQAKLSITFSIKKLSFTMHHHIPLGIATTVHPKQIIFCSKSQNLSSIFLEYRPFFSIRHLMQIHS